LFGLFGIAGVGWAQRSNPPRLTRGVLSLLALSQSVWSICLRTQAACNGSKE
jgi:hypothetical protein